MRKMIAVSVLSLGLLAGSLFAEDEKKINFTGIIDMDVTADMDGNFNNNDDNTVTMEVKMSEKVTGYLGFTVVTGGMPAGGGGDAGLPSRRWGGTWATYDDSGMVDDVESGGLFYDGAWLSWEAAEGLTLTFGDVLYQYGGFNYYFYKYSSMITPESFLRGVEVTKALGSMELDFMVGAQDMDGTFGYALSLGVPMGENMSLSLYNAASSMRIGATPLMAGAEFTGTFGKLELKADFGLATDVADEDAEASIAVLVEPSLGITDELSLAATVYYEDDKGSRFNEELLVYAEPCYAFSDMVALGLPLEYHEYDMDVDETEEIWVVPTLYLYPADDTEIWLWGQVVLPSAEGSDPAYYIGSELIYEF